MTANGRCPRCRGFMLPDPDGPSCVNCGYVQYQGPGLGISAAIMSQPQGLVAQTALERFEDGQAEGSSNRRGNRSPSWWQQRKRRQRIEDEALGKAVARRLGVTLEELQSNAQDDINRGLRRQAIVELRSQGLSLFRIGNLLARRDDVIKGILEREKRARG